MPVTIKREISFEGVGLHSGRDGRVTLLPFDRTGVFFKTASGVYPIAGARIEEDQRLTGFRLEDGTLVRTAEHLLASVVGMGVESVLIELEGEEVPILDGSAHLFASAIADAGCENIGEKTAGRALLSPVFIDDAVKGRIIAAAPSDGFKVTYVIDYSGTPVGTQRASYDITPGIFLETISRARTFGLTSELEYLKNAGLAKGGSLDNALVFDEKKLVNEGGLRFPLEPVTHKVIDLLGDLAFITPVPVAHYVAICAGHDMHGRLTNRLKRVYEQCS